ncbi:MAG: hypothetical protein JXX29_05765 [Deltaproteobacteria bacterium]|nr:hypothetical protein [Deltaproteobacteria bacterium]MBN2671156.1 hypothetical protein [Deltaproteobacteria bacterium]
MKRFFQHLFSALTDSIRKVLQTLRTYIIQNRHSAHHVAGVPVIWWLSLICLLALAVHTPLLYGQFTNYDDGIQITQFSGVTDADWNTVKQMLTTNYEAKNSNPMYLSFAANWHLTPGSYRGFAVFNLAVLLIIVLLFYRFSGLFINSLEWRLLATTLFSVHSAKAEVVGWMSARCHFLGMPFFLGAFIAFDMYLNASTRGSKVRWYLLTLFLAGMAVLNKTVFITVVPLIILYDVYKRRRWNIPFVLDKLPILYVVLQIFWIGGKVSATTDRSLERSTLETILDRLPSATNIVSQYFADLFVPGPTSICADAALTPLTSFFDSTSSSSLFMYKLMPIANISILLLLLVSVALIWKKYKESLPFWGVFAIGAALFPVLGFVPFWVDFAFRFLWIPVVFFCLLAISALRVFDARLTGRHKWIIRGILAAYICWHGAQSFIISDTFDTTPKYWKNCVKHYPESQICLQKLVGSSIDLDVKSALTAQWQLMNVATNKQAVHKISGMVMADTLVRMGKPQLASLFYERALVWNNLRPQERTRAREYLRKNPVTEKMREAVLRKRWDVLW